MNQGTTKQYDEFIFRRLTEPISFFGHDLPPIVWVFVLATVLIVGAIYIGIMYLRDSRGVGIIWASLLGLLRAGVYATLAVIFLLPSRQQWEETSSSSKVIVLFDVSGSMGTRDDKPVENVAFDKMPTRSDKLLATLEDPKVKFFPNLTKNNPVSAYRFSTGLDPNFIYYDREGRTWTKEEYTALQEKMKLPTFDRNTLPEEQPLASAILHQWLQPSLDPNNKIVSPPELSSEDRERFDKIVARDKKLAGNKYFSGTNLGDAALNAIKADLNNMVQGIVIFTDGRSTEGDPSVFEDIAKQAKAANIPIFVVGIGEERPQVSLEIADLRAPQLVQPEDKFRVIMEFIGVGLAEKEFNPELRLTYSRKLDDGKEERLNILLQEEVDKKDPMKKRAEPIDLGQELIIRPETPPKFDRSNPPRAEVEFAIDAATLAKAANPSIDLATDDRAKGRKWEIGVTEGKTAFLHLQAVVPKDPLELFPQPLHKSEFVDFQVMKRPLRVLLFASAATHDFQFLNNMLIREDAQQRADLSVYVQPPPGKDATEWIKTIVLGVKKENLLVNFPIYLDQPREDKNVRNVNDLNEYDVIVAFDPDWTKLTDEQLKLVRTWCEKGGGIVLIGGPINTLQLARPGPSRERLDPILKLLPVTLKDVRIEALDRTTEKPWPLWIDPTFTDMEFLRLAEETNMGPPPFLDDWKEFFYGKENKEGKGLVKRGFYNYYPVEAVKPGALIVARFTDPRAKMKDGTDMPYIVLTDPSGGRRVVWIGWGETRRLRQHSEAFYERFWTKLLRYSGAGNQNSLVKRIKLDMSRNYMAGRYVTVDAKIDKSVGEPLAPRLDKDMPKIYLTLPPGLADKDIPTEYTMVPKKVRDESDKGKFSVRFQVKTPGDYQLELKVPETDDKLTQKFSVKESNPELDNTRPDFDQMYRLASEAETVFARMSEADRELLKKHLIVPKLEKKDEKADDKPDPLKDGKPRLYFNLKDADLIPSCMVTRTDTKQIRGKYVDLWDTGWDPFSFVLFGHTVHANWLFNTLALIVGLLSMEWLLRKLLRLA